MRTLFLLLLAGAAFALSPADETTDTFSLKTYGIEVYETGELYPPSEIEKAADENQFQCNGAIDYAHRFGFSLAETVLIGNIGSKAAGKLFSRYIGLKPRDSTTYNLRNKLESAITKFLGKTRPLQAGIYSVLVKRPCPGGLRLAAKQAITIAVADYNYAIAHGISRSDRDLLAAKAEIKAALAKYKGYNGFLDAEMLMFTGITPEGFNSITDSAISAAEHAVRAMRYGERHSDKAYEVSIS